MSAVTEGATTIGGGGPPARQLRPLSVGEILDGGLKLYVRNFATLWKIVAVVIVPITLINVIITGVSLPSGAFVHNGTLYTPTGTLGTPAAGVIGQIVLSFLAALIVQGALALSLVDAYIGHPLDWQESLKAGANRLGSLVWLALIAGVIVTIGFFALVLPGIWLVTVWSVCAPALMFERLGGFKALGRSFDLVRGRWWATFAELLVALIMLFIVLFVVGLVFTALSKGLSVGSTGLWLLLRFLSTTVADIIALPFLASVVAVIYIDLRVRKEALDLELMASNLGRAPAGVSATPAAATAGSATAESTFGSLPEPTVGSSSEPAAGSPPPPEWPPS
jgi:hypothetical protein